MRYNRGETCAGTAACKLSGPPRLFGLRSLLRVKIDEGVPEHRLLSAQRRAEHVIGHMLVAPAPPHTSGIWRRPSLPASLLKCSLARLRAKRAIVLRWLTKKNPELFRSGSLSSLFELAAHCAVSLAIAHALLA
jgi:hypothetical protein